MIKKILFTAFLCLMFSAVSHSQTAQNAQPGKIFGVVVSLDNGAIVQGVRVIVEGKGFRREIMSDDEGSRCFRRRLR